MNVHLITTYYFSKEPDRNDENLKCLLANAKNPLIYKIHLLLEGEFKPDLSALNEQEIEKILLIDYQKRPLFKDFFAYCRNIEGQDIKLVANSDIYFDETISIIPECLSRFDVVTLTRWDLQPDGTLKFYNNFKSQDCWFFINELPGSIGNYYLGQPGCDIRLLYEFKKAGISCYNPSLSVKAVHVHMSNNRIYLIDPNSVFVGPPFAYSLADFFWKDRNRPKELMQHFYYSRYSYHKQVASDTLRGIENSIFRRLISFIRSKYYAYKYNSVSR